MSTFKCNFLIFLCFLFTNELLAQEEATPSINDNCGTAPLVEVSPAGEFIYFEVNNANNNLSKPHQLLIFR